jgi:hypothetical protein
MNRCKENRRISSVVWDFIEFVNDVGEESITDYLVWQWRKLNEKFNYLDVKKHTRQKENKISGADFELELWILTYEYNISFVFQAKKLLDDYGSYYSKLNYQNGKIRQVDMLIKFAKSKNRLPFYILYTQPNNATITQCPMNKIEKTALFMTDAHTIDSFTSVYKNRPLSKNKILEKTNPFHCMFCCPLAIDDFKQYFKNYFPNIDENAELFSEDIPNYVNMIANNEFQNIDEVISQNELFVYRNIGVLDLRKESPAHNRRS